MDNETKQTDLEEVNEKVNNQSKKEIEENLELVKALCKYLEKYAINAMFDNNNIFITTKDDEGNKMFYIQAASFNINKKGD